jgi:predicted TIM-barrel fold metal-dependent hydrolase
MLITLLGDEPVLYGTDLDFGPGNSIRQALKEWQVTYARDWTYFATAETLQYHGHEVRGLELPTPVLRKIFHTNATRWIPGIESSNP